MFWNIRFRASEVMDWWRVKLEGWGEGVEMSDSSDWTGGRRGRGVEDGG